MIERYNLPVQDLRPEASKELLLLSIIAQSSFQSFSLEDNLLAILTALTSGSGIGFNRAMLFQIEGDQLRGKAWLGPRSVEEARLIWEVLSTPSIGYIEIIEHNRALLKQSADNLTERIQNLSYSLEDKSPAIPALPVCRREVIAVRDAWNEPAVDRQFQEIINVNEFVCIPLIARDEVLGEIVLDNAITQSPIEARDIKLASICGLIAGNYIYTTSLHNKLVEMEKLAALGEMAMFITHQLRNPLVAIGGFTDQLLNPQTDEQKRKRNLEIIRNEVRRLEEVLLKLPRYLKLEIKEPKPFLLPIIFRHLLASFETRVKVKNIRLQVDIPEGLPLVKCDAMYAEEAIRNLLDNALDATPPGGEITIRSFTENKEWLVVTIQDTGKGMSEDIKAKIFVPFFSTKDKGFGLGLFYVKRVMDACGGMIQVESEEGKGTFFKLYFRYQERGVGQ